ncbi:hypothetical protein HOF65_03170 [bacterium]|nr:hypothetical protein [bacterium]
MLSISSFLVFTIFSIFLRKNSSIHVNLCIFSTVFHFFNAFTTANILLGVGFFSSFSKSSNS